MITAEEFIELRDKCKQEFKRRSCSAWGSLSEYADTDYDFDTEPSAGTAITAEQGQKVIDPLLEIKDFDNLTKKIEAGDLIQAGVDSSLLDAVDSLSTESTTSTSTSCRGACTGLCLGTCYSSCDGCSGCSGCSSGCSGCSASCESNCTGCSGSCSGCSGSCSGEIGRAHV